MDSSQLKSALLRRFSLRVEDEMLHYILKHLDSHSPATFPVIGGDARTGLPLRQTLDPAALDSESPPTNPKSAIPNPK